jgi:uncharacterized protein (TIGR03083 family)
MTVSNKTTQPSKKEVIEQLSAERHELLDLCHELTPGEWNQPSLCAGWLVRDVVAHVAASQNEVGAYLRTFSEDGGNRLIVDKRKGVPLKELLQEFEASVEPNWLTRLLAAMFLWDNWVHQQDIRWALGEDRQRTQDPARLRIILSGPTMRMVKRRKNFRFEATDLGWQAGDGAVVRGPAEAIIMALAGRPVALARLDGPGLPAFKALFGNIPA